MAAETASQVSTGLLRALANPQRLTILTLLSAGELSVSDLRTHIARSPSALSQHLGKLRAEDLVATWRQAQAIYYRIADDEASAMARALPRRADLGPLSAGFPRPLGLQETKAAAQRHQCHRSRLRKPRLESNHGALDQTGSRREFRSGGRQRTPSASAFFGCHRDLRQGAAVASRALTLSTASPPDARRK
jgi:DNA-binding transcriptional ArsR family regulator